MKKFVKDVAVVAVAGGVAAGLMYGLLGTEDDVSVEKSSRQRSPVAKKSVNFLRSAGAAEKAPDYRSAERIDESDRPGLEFRHVMPAADDEVDESELTELQQKVLQELQDALDHEDLRAVRKALARYVARSDAGGLGGSVPKCMRQQAVAALGWFGKDAAVDLVEYLADSDEEVSSEAFDRFEEALQDVDLQAQERADLLVSIMRGLNDAERIDSLLFNLNDLPNSMKARVVGEILEHGTSQARATMQEQLEIYLDDEVRSVDDIPRWVAENPDDD